MPKFLISDRTLNQIARIKEGLMDYTSSLERSTIETTDDWNDEVAGDYQVLPDRLPCSYKASYQERDSRTAEFVDVPPRLTYPLGTDVRLTDRVVDIRDRHDAAVQPARFEIKSIEPRMGDLLLVLQAVG